MKTVIRSIVHFSPSRIVTFILSGNLEDESQVSESGGLPMKTKSLLAAACLSGLMAGTMVAQTQQGKNNDQQAQNNSEKSSSKNSPKNSSSQTGSTKSASKDKNSCGGKNGCGSKPK
jgi:hypothetical protein